MARTAGNAAFDYGARFAACGRAEGEHRHRSVAAGAGAPALARGAVLGDITNKVTSGAGPLPGGRSGSCRGTQARSRPPSGRGAAKVAASAVTATSAAAAPALGCGAAVPAAAAAPLASFAGATGGYAAASDSTAMDVDFDASMDCEELQHVSEYLPDIYRHLREHERDMVPMTDYMASQPEINAKMRAILVDWLVEVHMKYKLRPATLFLAINITDRYLSVRQVARKRLQLVGVAGMLIAAKFEEIYPPELSEFVFITDNAYTKEEVLAMETAVLTSIGFNLCCPLAIHFLDQYQRANRCSEVHRHLLQYILELTLPEYRMLRYAPSQIVAAAVYVSNKLMKVHPSWPPAMARHSKLAAPQLKELALELCQVLEAAERDDSLQAVRKKFSQASYSCVGKKRFCSAN